MSSNHRNQRGFTLLEVLLVVAIIAILAGIVIIAINPAKQLGDSRNSQRMTDVQTILNAVHQYGLDNGSVPASVTATPTEICNTGVAGATCTAGSLIDLTVVTTAGKYVSSMPKDPQCPTGCATNGNGYRISKNATSGRVTVTAINPEQGKTVTVTK